MSPPGNVKPALELCFVAISLPRHSNPQPPTRRGGGSLVGALQGQLGDSAENGGNVERLDAG